MSDLKQMMMTMPGSFHVHFYQQHNQIFTLSTQVQGTDKKTTRNKELQSYQKHHLTLPLPSMNRWLITLSSTVIHYTTTHPVVQCNTLYSHTICQQHVLVLWSIINNITMIWEASEWMGWTEKLLVTLSVTCRLLHSFNL